MDQNKFSEKIILENLKRSPRDLTDDQIKIYVPYILKAELSFSDKVYYNSRICQVIPLTDEARTTLCDKFFHFNRVGGNKRNINGRK